jgi:tRNA threonylcarbamoyl adenosine modification protein YeaZ/ribosomal-protein-alanine acetyltransferase
VVILALETATRRGSMALLANGAWHAAVSADESRTHAERLPGVVIDWLAGFGLTVRDVDRLAIVTGPGSFTGLRVGLAAIQGFAMAMGQRVIPVPTLDAVAEGWLSRAPADGASMTLAPCVDGQRGEVYVSAFEGTAGTPLEEWRSVIAPEAMRPEQAAARLSALRTHRLAIVGDGAVAYERTFRSAVPDAAVEPFGGPLALGAVRLAARRTGDAVAPHAVRPLYLRRPDVEQARARRDGGNPLTLTIELATDGRDVGAVESLQRRAFTNAWGAEAIRWELENTDVARLYVARGSEGTLVAYCACWMIFDELHINSLAVEDAWRRHGIARRLLKRVIDESVRAGARSATLEVRASNTAARALYEGLGFTVEGVRRDYYQEPREDALILWNRRLFAPG